jgi:hypothetical protein
MNTQHESGNLNGSATLYLMVGRLSADMETVKSDVRETRQNIRALTKRLDTTPLRSTIKQKAGDIAPYLTGLVVLALATAGKWAELGKFLHAFAK